MKKLPLKQALAVHTAMLSLQPPPFLCSSIQLQKNYILKLKTTQKRIQQLVENNFKHFFSQKN